MPAFDALPSGVPARNFAHATPSTGSTSCTGMLFTILRLLYLAFLFMNRPLAFAPPPPTISVLSSCPPASVVFSHSLSRATLPTHHILPRRQTPLHYSAPPHAYQHYTTAPRTVPNRLHRAYTPRAALYMRALPSGSTAVATHTAGHYAYNRRHTAQPTTPTCTAFAADAAHAEALPRAYALSWL